MRIFWKIGFLLIAATCVRLHGQTTELAKFSGTVVDMQGQPVAGAVVECFHFPTYAVAGMPEIESKQFQASDTNGAYSFSVPAGAVIVTAKKSGFGSVWKMWQTAPSGLAEPLALRPPSTLSGIVVDENDQPVSNAVVSVSAATDKGKGDWAQQPNFLFGDAARDLFSTNTSADGHFRILNFPLGGLATLDVTAPGRALRTGGRNGMQLQLEAGRGDIKLVTDTVASIEGKVIERDTGAPLANAKIRLDPVNAGGGITLSPAATQSDASGAFRIPEVPAGSYRIVGVFTNQPIPLWVTESVPVSVAPGETVENITIKAFKGGVVELTVVGKGDQKAVPEVNVSTYGGGSPASGMTGPEGVAWFRLPAGQFVLFGKKSGLSQAQIEATVAEGQTNRVRLELDLPPREVVSKEPVPTGAATPPPPARQPVSTETPTAASNPLLKWASVGIGLFAMGAIIFWAARKRKP